MEPREMENLEKVEQLVEKAGCTYAEAKDALEYSDWNLLDAIIRLEHEGKAVKSSAAYKAADPQEAPKSGSYVEPEVIRAEEAEHIKPDEFKKESRSGYGNGSFGEDARHYGQQAAGAAKGFFGRAKEALTQNYMTVFGRAGNQILRLPMWVLLILLPAALLFFRDLAAEPLSQRVLMALFQAVTPRTAGFNTMDIESLTEAGRIVLVGLMLTGGAPGSTAGGVKVTTAFVLMASAVASLRMKTDIACFKRRIAPQSLQQAVTIFLLYLGLFAGSTFLISEIDAIPVIDCMVETSSALGTVGLSIGLTEHLSVASQLILIGLMYFGRVGALTMIYTLNNQYRPNRGRLPEEKITVG